MISPEVARTHSDTLKEWARLYERDGRPGGSETSFLLLRTARLIDKGLGLPVEEEKVIEAAEEMPRAG